MTTRSQEVTTIARTKHPDLESEQAYVERVHDAHAAMLARKENAPDLGADAHASRQLRNKVREKALSSADLEKLCFARIDPSGNSAIYIGREAVWGESASELLAISWQAPAAEPFYLASRDDPLGLRLRRRFQLQGSRLVGLQDEHFTAAEAPSASPESTEVAGSELTDSPEAADQSYDVTDAILADMERARGSEMQDIVATIAAGQYQLISAPTDGLLVIQGGPGTGKTAVALHRAAWVLFNHREEFEREGILVVGPNRAFMEYVSAVLPSLGESAVEQRPIDRVAAAREVRVQGQESEKVERLKGDARMAELVARALTATVKVPSKPTSISIARGNVEIKPDKTQAVITSINEKGGNYERRRKQFRKQFVSLVERQAKVDLKGQEKERARGAADRIWPSVEPAAVVARLLSDPDFLRKSADGLLTADEQALLLREQAEDVRRVAWTQADIPLIDEAQVLIEGLDRIYGYAIVDEAQDLTPMQLRMVLRRVRDGRATLVGDIAQATGAWRYSTWTELVEGIPDSPAPELQELPVGYRVPSQVMAIAGPLVTRIAPDLTPPEAVRSGPEDPRLVKTSDEEILLAVEAEVHRRSDGVRSAAVIAPEAALTDIRAALEGAGITVGDVRSDGLSRGLTLLTAVQAKGLEFDHAIVVDPAEIVASYQHWAPLYVALTRCTRTLSIVHRSEQAIPDDIPPAPSDSDGVQQLPGSDGSAGDSSQLGARFTEALMQAKFLHAGQQRRGTTVPYFAHLLATSALVLEDGGSEDEAIAALLHDSVEDHGPAVLDEISQRFGPTVAEIVAGCTDPAGASDDETWREAKTQHLLDLEQAGALVRRVALAEKLENARALARDYQRYGPSLWDRMGVEPDDLLWYVDSLADLFNSERPGDMAGELRATVDQLLEAVTTDSPESTATPAATSR